MDSQETTESAVHKVPVAIMGRDRFGKLWVIDIPHGAPIPSHDDIIRMLQPPKLPPRRRPSRHVLRLHERHVRAGRE